MSSLLGPLTDADLRRMMRRRYDLLGRFLDLADKHDLPPLTWKVGNHALAGEAAQPAYADRRRAWEQWVTVLHLERWEPSTSASGRTHLHAVSQDWQGSRVPVAVVADVFDEPGDGS